MRYKFYNRVRPDRSRISEIGVHDTGKHLVYDISVAFYLCKDRKSHRVDSRSDLHLKGQIIAGVASQVIDPGVSIIFGDEGIESDIIFRERSCTCAGCRNIGTTPSATETDKWNFRRQVDSSPQSGDTTIEISNSGGMLAV